MYRFTLNKGLVSCWLRFDLGCVWFQLQSFKALPVLVVTCQIGVTQSWYMNVVYNVAFLTNQGFLACTGQSYLRCDSVVNV